MGAVVAGRSPRILIVEDEATIRDLLEALLSQEGFVVESAPNGLSALALLEQRPFALMVTDVVLPGELDCVATVRYARARHPELKSLFISGRLGPVCDDSEQDDFVSKPFHARELLGCIWELLLRDTPKHRVNDPQRAAELAILEAKINCLKKTPEVLPTCKPQRVDHACHFDPPAPTPRRR